jgi:hypothetical protein
LRRALGNCTILGILQFCNFAFAIFTCVGTYVQRGSKFCFVVVLLVLVAANLLRILHFRPISPCFQLLSILCHCIHVTLPGSLARQPCPTALPGSLARQFDQFRPDLMRALARSAVTALYYTAVAGHQTACARCCCPDRFKLVFSPISPCFHYLHALRALLSSRQVLTCSVVLR